MEALRTEYLQQAESMSKKSRYGFFSILPSHTAGFTCFEPTPCKKTSDGRVQTQERNFYSGKTASGVLKGSYFSVPKSIYSGDPYKDPQIINERDRSPKVQEVFKPAKLNKTLASPSYQYISNKKSETDHKKFRNQNGSVKIQQPNIVISVGSKIDYEKQKKFSHQESPYDALKIEKKKDLQDSIRKRRGQGPFKTGVAKRKLFSSNFETFNDHLVKKPFHFSTQKNVCSNFSHQSAFRPSCRRNFGFQGLFSYPGHLPENVCKQNRSKISSQIQNAEIFKVSKRPASSKPCPSITMINSLRKIR